MACFTACSMGLPMPAFAATSATVADSYMKKLLKNVFCAGLASVMTVTFIHPVDVVKTRMQVASNAGQNASLGYTVNSPRVSLLIGNALKFMTQVLTTESLKVELLNWVMKLV